MCGTRGTYIVLVEHSREREDYLEDLEWGERIILKWRDVMRDFYFINVIPETDWWRGVANKITNRRVP
jgi:hypothetical protein